MALPIFNYLINDLYKPQTSKPSLQQYDNYQIYTLVCIDRVFANTKTEYYPSTAAGLQPVYDPVNHTYALVPLSTPVITNSTNSTKKLNWLAIQSFSPVGINVNFLNYVNQYHGQ
jgi:hypothetical protein